MLDLIRKQELDIYDIPIAQITAQYLDYIHRLQELDIDVAGEFIYMAATLIHIKSRMLLPPDPTLPPEQQEDPRQELVDQLLEYEKFKQAAQVLHERQMLEAAAWSNPALGAEAMRRLHCPLCLLFFFVSVQPAVVGSQASRQFPCCWQSGRRRVVWT